MNKQRGLFRKTFVILIFILFILININTSSGRKNNNSKILESNKNIENDVSLLKINLYNGSLLGYVNDTSGDPIEGALVRVHFHETYVEDYSDSTGFYHVTNIPICYCMKNTTCSKSGYKTEWVLLSIAENTTYNFVLTSGNNPPIKPEQPSGPTWGRPSVPYTYTTVTTDIDGDDISYLFDWGDGTTSGWTQFYTSGTKASATHAWSKQGSFFIRVKAKDIYDAESEWSDSMNIPIKKEKSNPSLYVDYKVIITHIRGFGILNWLYNWGMFRGEANLTEGIFRLSGFRWRNGTIEYFEEFAEFVYAYRFVGYTLESNYNFFSTFIRGIAFGDISWY